MVGKYSSLLTGNVLLPILYKHLPILITYRRSLNSLKLRQPELSLSTRLKIVTGAEDLLNGRSGSLPCGANAS